MAAGFSRSGTNHGVVGLFRPLPTLVAIHSVVTAADGSHAAGSCLVHDALELADKFHPARGRCVAPIGERVDEDAIELVAGCPLHERLEMALVAMDAVRRQEFHPLQTTVC